MPKPPRCMAVCPRCPKRSGTPKAAGQGFCKEHCAQYQRERRLKLRNAEIMNPRERAIYGRFEAITTALHDAVTSLSREVSVLRSRIGPNKQ